MDYYHIFVQYIEWSWDTLIIKIITHEPHQTINRIFFLLNFWYQYWYVCVCFFKYIIHNIHTPFHIHYFLFLFRTDFSKIFFYTICISLKSYRHPLFLFLFNKNKTNLFLFFEITSVYYFMLLLLLFFFSFFVCLRKTVLVTLVITDYRPMTLT